MSHNITQEQQASENLDMKAAMWANKIMTRKLTNHQCKFEISQKFGDDEAQDMQGRVRRYLKAGLVTEESFKSEAQQQIERIKQQAKKPPAQISAGGSKDGLWSKPLGSKK